MADGKRRCRDIKLRPKSEWRSRYSRHRLDPDRDVRTRCSAFLMDVLRAAGIPEYLDIRSNHLFSYLQKIVLLVMMEWTGLSFRRFEEESDSNIRMFRAIGLDICPDYSTLCKFRKTVDPEHLAIAVLAFSCVVGDGATVAVDGTSLANYDRSSHYIRRMDSFGVTMPRTFTKLSIVADTETKIVMAHEVDAAEPTKHDTRDVPALVSKLSRTDVDIEYLAADRGYDSEEIHRLIERELGATALIPARKSKYTWANGKSRTKGTRRNRMRKKLVKCTHEGLAYNMRGIVETANFMIKTNFRKTLSAKLIETRENTVSLRIIGHNLRRIADMNLFRAMGG